MSDKETIDTFAMLVGVGLFVAFVVFCGWVVYLLSAIEHHLRAIRGSLNAQGVHLSSIDSNTEPLRRSEVVRG